MVGTASWGKWVDVMLYSATNGSWHNLSENVGCEIWRSNGTYIEPTMEVTKTVWNGTAWVDELDAYVGDTIRFKWVLNNTGEHNMTNITVFDFLSSSLEYADNATQDPYLAVPLTMGNHTLGTLLVWNFTGVVLEPYENITVEYNTSIVQCGADINFLFGVGLFKDTEEHSFGCDFAMVQVPCPSGNATDSVGGVQDMYNIGEPVYATGNGFGANKSVDIYIIPFQLLVGNEDLTALKIVGPVGVTTDNNGDISPEQVWPNPIMGHYLIIFDDPNGRYDPATDTYDDFSVTGVAAPVVTPLGIVALIGLLSIVATSTIVRKKKRE